MSDSDSDYEYANLSESSNKHFQLYKKVIFFLTIFSKESAR